MSTFAETFKNMQVCPKCKRPSERLLALSRRDNKTMICDACGQAEAIEDYMSYAKKQKK